MARLVLVGMPGVGKTTIADALAARWNCAAVDTDLVIASAVGTSSANYLRENGEVAFRAREVEALEDVCSGDHVVATGGGAVVTIRGRELLQREVTLWLDCADDVLVDRLTVGDRPLIGRNSHESLAHLRQEREPWYREVSRARIDASGTVDEVTQRILREVAALPS